jgi:hypothetical protein
MLTYGQSLGTGSPRTWEVENAVVAIAVEDSFAGHFSRAEDERYTKDWTVRSVVLAVNHQKDRMGLRAANVLNPG